jgi:hypothetical protein
MPSAFFNPRGEPARAAEAGEIAIEPATLALIESNAEPRWGQFLRTWEALAAAKGRYPLRAEIDPAALGGKLLPHVFMVDVVATPGRKQPRFRFRLLGQSILDRESTRPGDYLDALGASAEIAKIERHYLACIDGKISIRPASLVWSDSRKDYLKYGVLMLPLSDDGIGVTHLLGLALYEF